MKTFLKYWLPVIIWAGVIFYSSSQPYQDQNLKPFLSDEVPLGWVETYFGDVSFHYAGGEVSVDQLGKSGFVEFFIRKGAHLTVYLILALLIYRALAFATNIKSVTIPTFLLSIVYAASDEFHQGFTPNRSPHFEDVLLDSAGVVMGAMIAHMFYKRKKGSI